MVTIDNEELIHHVFVRPAIWDRREKSHSNRIMVDRCWKDIAKEMGIDENALRRKWKYLREQFCVELGKVPNLIVDDESSYSDLTKWSHFRSLLFLKDVVKPRLTEKNASNLFITVPVDPKNFTEDDDEDLLDEKNILPEDSVTDSDSVFGSVVLCSPSHQTQDHPNILSNTRKRSYPTESVSNKKGTVTTDPRECDEDMLFFKSIMPHVKKVKSAQILLLRSKILEVVSEFAYPQQPSSFSSNPRPTVSRSNVQKKNNRVSTNTGLMLEAEQQMSDSD